MKYAELVRLAQARMNYPEVADVVVGNKLWDWIKTHAAGAEAQALGRLKVHRSEFLADGYVLGRDHRGDIVRIWGPAGEQKLPAQEALFPLSQYRRLEASAARAAAEGGDDGG
jgi:hypothetical protein